MGIVITVSGAVGGIGASTFAYALALEAGSARKSGHVAALIDAQSDGAPLDVVVGAESVQGIRWSQVQIRSADISCGAILSALPTHHGVAVLSADRDAHVDVVALGYLVAVLRTEACTVVLDIPARHPLRKSLCPDIDLLLLPPTLCGIAAAHVAMHEATQLVHVDIGRADVTEQLLAEFLGRAPVGRVRWQRSVTAGAVAGGRLPRASEVMRLAAEIVGAVGGAGTH